MFFSLFYSSTLEDRLAKLSDWYCLKTSGNNGKLIGNNFITSFYQFFTNNKHIGDNVVQINVVIKMMLIKCHDGIVANSFLPFIVSVNFRKTLTENRI